MQDRCRRGAVEMQARCRGALVPQVDRLATFRATGGTHVMDVVRLLEQVKAVLQERPAQRLDGADVVLVVHVQDVITLHAHKDQLQTAG